MYPVAQSLNRFITPPEVGGPKQEYGRGRVVGIETVVEPRLAGRAAGEEIIPVATAVREPALVEDAVRGAEELIEPGIAAGDEEDRARRLPL